MSNDYQYEVWIPSKDRICDNLVEDLKIILRSTHPDLKELKFTAWIRDNFAILSYLGERYTSYIIKKVSDDLGLELSEQGYIKKKDE